MTREEIKNTPELVVFMLDESITVDTRMKLNKRLEELCKLAIKALEQEQKTGHWINVNEGKWNTIPAYKCSACGANADLRDWSGESPFCPWCGAKMVELQESEVQE